MNRILQSKKKSARTPIFFLTIGILIGTLVVALFSVSSPIVYVIKRVTKKPICENCNVILISIDTLSALHLPCYGYAKNTAPNLCAFAKKNTYFPHSFAQSYFTLPSHFSLFTGQYPSTHGMLEKEGPPLNPGLKTIPETLSKNGYETLYFGPTMSNELPLDRGIGRGFSYIHPVYNFDRSKGLQTWTDGVQMLRNNNKKGQKTFLFLHTYFVHEPYLPNTRTLRFTDDTVAEIPVNDTEYFTFSPEYIQYARDFFRQNPAPYDAATASIYQRFMRTPDEAGARVLYDELTKKDCPRYCLMRQYFYDNKKDDPRATAYVKSLYDELIFQLDEQLQPILTSLDPELHNNTMLIITADHGEEFTEHSGVFHRSLYGEILRVPLIISLPGLSSRVITAQTQGIDLYPTILSVLGIPQPTKLSGTDLTPLMFGIPLPTNSHPVIAERFDTKPAYMTTIPVKERAVVTDRWKLYIKSIDQPEHKNLELYDVRSDPWDHRNVADKYPNIVQSLLSVHAQFAASHSIVYPAPQDARESAPPDQTQRYFHY